MVREVMLLHSFLQHNLRQQDSQSLAAAMGALGAREEANAGEVGGVSVAQAEFVIVDFPQYVGPLMVSDHPPWVCIPKQT